MDKEEGGAVSKPMFKSVKKKRPLRRRHSSSGSDKEGNDTANVDKEDSNENPEEASSAANKLQETLEIQKLRKRPKGVNVATLALGKKVTKLDELVNGDPDPFKLKTGGLLTLDQAKGAMREENSQDGGGGGGQVGTQFSKETRVRDEDEEMRKFIEQEMEKRRRQGGGTGTGSEATIETTSGGGGGSNSKYMTPEDAALAALPAHLKASSSSHKSEEMLSSQMLSGIPEVDLGIDEKIRNIEATEAAKKKVAEARMLKARSGHAPSEFVPTNLAVNFKSGLHRFRQPEDEVVGSLQHRFMQIRNESSGGAGKAGGGSGKGANEKEKPVVTQRTVVVGQVPQERVVSKNDSRMNENDPNRATDDLHVTKFKKHFQRK